MDQPFRFGARSARVAVRDWGIGIPRAEQGRIFERFHRVPTDLVHDVKGSGLGLALVQHIVEAHGGRVAVESRAGEGATFWTSTPRYISISQCIGLIVSIQA